MFHSARIKLTAWYLLIIMLISVSFSGAIYRVLSFELDRVQRIQKLRIEHRFPQRPWTMLPHSTLLDPDVIAETKNRLLLILTGVNGAILVGAGIAGYFLAGRTLLPIKQMIDEQNRFITDASHELRTPLTALKAEIEVNLRGTNLTLAQAKKILESNLEEVNNLQVLSDGLIKLTQYQKGDNGLTVRDVSLAALINEAVKKVSHAAKIKHIAIVDATADYIFEGNKPTLTELFVILLDNAIKYSPKQTTVHLTSEKIDDQIFIHITDQGIGIDAEDIPHIFDRFYRTDKSRTKSHVPGYGLGLSIAKQIVDKHNGSIKVQSKPNKGTTFTVRLPLKHSLKLL